MQPTFIFSDSQTFWNSIATSKFSYQPLITSAHAQIQWERTGREEPRPWELLFKKKENVLFFLFQCIFKNKCKKNYNIPSSVNVKPACKDSWKKFTFFFLRGMEDNIALCVIFTVVNSVTEKHLWTSLASLSSCFRP